MLPFSLSLLTLASNQPDRRAAGSDTIGLSERIRARIESAGRITLDDVARSALVLSKTVHIILIVVAILLGTALMGSGSLAGTLVGFGLVP